MRYTKLWMVAILLLIGNACVLTSCSDDNPAEKVLPQKYFFILYLNHIFILNIKEKKL